MLLALKLQVAAAALAGAIGPLAVAAFAPDGAEMSNSDDGIAVVRLSPGTFDYRVAGAFTRDGAVAPAPRQTVHFERPLLVMRHLVTVAAYDACVREHGCAARPADASSAPLLPAVQVSYRDARAYAAWLSRRTGRRWRLPTDAEWAYAAGDRYFDDVLPVDPNDPAKASLARYTREAERGDVDATPRPIGSFGANDKGLLDVAGNVWEWTESCYARRALDATGTAAGTTTRNCGIRVVEGRHRAYMPDFIRDARAGGCSAGTPPSNFGIRLVREAGEPTWRQRLLAGLARLADAVRKRPPPA